MTADNN